MNAKRSFVPLFALLLALFLVVGCSGRTAQPEPTAVAQAAVPTEAMAEPTEVPMEEATAPVEAMEEPMDDAMMADATMEDWPAITAADLQLDGTAGGLRVSLNRLMGEHVLLATSATGAALDGRQAEFEAAASALDQNSQTLAAAIGAVYGDDAGAAFLELWRTHIGFFVDYTMGTAANDQAMKDEALANLADYGQDFAAFLAGANPNIDPDAIIMNLDHHVQTLTGVIDAQAAGDQETALADLREAYAHMSSTAAVLSSAIATQYPDAFPGEALSPAVDMRVALVNLLSEHTYLAAIATGDALGGRTDAFTADTAALDENTVDLSNAIASVYGEDAGDAFRELWRRHIGFFVDYTNGVAANDQAMKDAAVDGLLDYRADFIAFLNGANENLTSEVLTPLLTPHVMTLTGVIDAQGALREAYAHMQMIGDPLAGAIAAQFPEQFPVEAAMMGDMAGMDHSMDDAAMTGDMGAMTGSADLRTALTNLLGEHVLLASSATGAALGGRQADFEAAAAALDENSQALAGAIGSVYGEDAQAAFLELWRTHIGFFVDYTMGAAAGDQAMMDEARANLADYGQDFAAFLGGANPFIDTDAIIANLDTHVQTLTAAIDAQAAGDPETAFANLHKAYAHMSMTALALSDAIAQQFPEQFSGSANSPAAGLRALLNAQLAEHTYLASLATDAALGGREAEFGAAAAALDENTQALAASIGSVYGDAAGEAFLELWRTHIGFFVDYTNGVAVGDEDMKAAAIDGLLEYRADFIAFLNGANPDAFTEEVLTPILTPHVLTLTAVIDAQGAGDPVAAYSALREAYAHMQHIADPLSDGIVQQFPDQFGQ